MAARFRYGAWRSIFYAIVALCFATPFAWLARETYDELTLIGAWTGVIGALTVAGLMLRQAFDQRAAIELRVEGLYALRLNGVIEWDEIISIRLRQVKRRIFYFIPIGSVDLVVQVESEAAFWSRRGAYRRFLRFLSGLSGRWEVEINLSAMAPRTRRQLDLALRTVRPDLMQPIEIVERRHAGEPPETEASQKGGAPVALLEDQTAKKR